MSSGSELSPAHFEKSSLVVLKLCRFIGKQSSSFVGIGLVVETLYRGMGFLLRKKPSHGFSFLATRNDSHVLGFRRIKSKNSTLLRMPPGRRKLTPIEVLDWLLKRLEKRMEALQRVKLPGFEMVITELEVEQDFLRRARRYLEDDRPAPEAV
jgi:hypothetical protein